MTAKASSIELGEKKNDIAQLVILVSPDSQQQVVNAELSWTKTQWIVET